MTETKPPVSVDLEPRPEGVRFFATAYRVRTGDVDQDMRLRLDGLARYLQDIANDNIEATEFNDTDPFWIVRRTIIDVKSPITWPGDVHLERWVGALSTRWTDMRIKVTSEHETNRFNPDPRPDGLIETSAFWINVNDQGMPSRLSDAAFETLSHNVPDNRLRWKTIHVPTPPADDSTDRVHRLRATDYDPFKHLNNAAYWEVVEDELAGVDGEPGHKDLVEGKFTAAIEYLRAITPRPQITIRRQRTGDELALWFLIDNPDGEGQVVAATATVTKQP